MLALTKDFLRHFSEGTDVDKLLPKLPGQGGSHPPMDQRTENKIMGDGTPVEALPLDDHVAHLAELEKFSASPAFESLPESAVMLIAMHKMQHEQMLRQQLSARGRGRCPCGRRWRSEQHPDGYQQRADPDGHERSGGRRPVMDEFELDSIADIAKTEGFGILLGQLHELADHLDAVTVGQAATSPLDQIRFAAGKASGVRLVISKLRQAKEQARNA